MFETEFILTRRGNFNLVFDSIVQKEGMHAFLEKRDLKFKEE